MHKYEEKEKDEVNFAQLELGCHYKRLIYPKTHLR